MTYVLFCLALIAGGAQTATSANLVLNGDARVMSGIFLVPQGTMNLVLQRSQAERKESPQDGSAARFADGQVRVFETEAAARAFVREYSRR